MHNSAKIENALDIALMKKLLEPTDKQDNQIEPADAIMDMNSAQEKYERMRYQKLYGKDPMYADVYPDDFISRLTQLEKDFPTTPILINAYTFFTDDFCKDLPASDSMQDIMLDLLYRRIGVKIMQNTKRKLHIQLYCQGEQIVQAAKALESFAVINFMSKEFSLGIQSIRPNLTQKINSCKDPMPYFIKQTFNNKIRKPTDAEFEVMEKLAPYVFPYLKNRHATLQKIVINKLGQQELRFYRHNYVPEHYTIKFNTEEDLINEIVKGAFCFIVDSSCMKGEIPVGPYYATIDLDSELPLYSQLEYVDKFSSFLKNYVNITDYSLVHSGNKSFHFRFSLGELDDCENHVILPRLEQYDTFMRRRNPEIKLTYVRDAAEILILAFNTLVLDADQRVCCRIPKYANKSRYPMIFDNRTQVSGGARIPLSFHTKSGRYAIVFEKCKVPDNEAEIMAMGSLDYIQSHIEKITCPEITKTDMIRNKNHLFTFTDSFMQDNFEKLLNKDKIFVPP